MIAIRGDVSTAINGASLPPRRENPDDHRPTSELRRQRRQAVVLAERPAVFDRYVLSLDIAIFRQSPKKRGKQMWDVLGGPRAEKPDHGYRWRLRVRRKRPRRGAADKRNELASPHIRCQAQETALYRSKQVL
jgi:hypothetical protein